MNQFEIFNEYNFEDDYSYLDDVINHTLDKLNIKNAYLSIIFIDDEKMHEMNNSYRGIDRTTDVLSFAYEDNLSVECDERELGDIFVSIPKMKEQAKEYNHSEKRELSFLVVHGLLHLLGYDHTLGEKEEKEQFELQDEILNELNITR
jgi:probable rRNA maturation factor